MLALSLAPPPLRTNANSAWQIHHWGHSTTGSRKRPLSQPARAKQIEQRAGGGDSGSHADFEEGVCAIDEQKDETGHSSKRGQRVERYAEGARQLRTLHPQKDDTGLLEERTAAGCA